MPPSRSLIKVLFALTLLAGVVWFYYGFATAEGRVRALCDQIRPGMALPALAAFASEHGLGPVPRRGDGVVYVVEGRTYGRFGCRVEMAAGAVQSSAYNFAD